MSPIGMNTNDVSTYADGRDPEAPSAGRITISLEQWDRLTALSRKRYEKNKELEQDVELCRVALGEQREVIEAQARQIQRLKSEIGELLEAREIAELGKEVIAA